MWKGGEKVGGRRVAIKREGKGRKDECYKRGGFQEEGPERTSKI